MKRTLIVTAILCLAGIAGAKAQTSGISPTATIKFEQRDTCELFFDYYAPAGTSEASPTVIFIFGGGFKGGYRSQPHILPWFQYLVDNGFGVVAIDYRLGMKGKRFGRNLRFVKDLKGAIDVAVEDLFSATDFLIHHGDSLGIDASKLIVSGSSAGAITSLQAEWEICNNGPLAAVLPEGFNYKGVIALSGAIFSDKGRVKYAKEPCPQLLFHGTADNIVPYRQISLFNIHFAGSNAIAKVLARNDDNYRIYRMVGNYHEIASNSYHFKDIELDFIRRNALAGEKIKVDATVTDPSIVIPDWARASTEELINDD
ncbi:MAG: alpha/beta hydrolase [Bacteroidales bacterium]|nr:alpha/beta hydrolase [Bacteroidales bacterium]